MDVADKLEAVLDSDEVDDDDGGEKISYVDLKAMVIKRGRQAFKEVGVDRKASLDGLDGASK